MVDYMRNVDIKHQESDLHVLRVHVFEGTCMLYCFAQLNLYVNANDDANETTGSQLVVVV